MRGSTYTTSLRRAAGRFAILLLVPLFSSLAQQDPMIYQRWNIMNINRVRTQFNSTGLLCDGNEQNIPLARPPAFEYPNGSGLSWGTCVGVVIGAPGVQDPGAVSGDNPKNLEYLDGTMDEGPAAFWDEEHFAPYPEVAGRLLAPLSTDRATWPAGGWPAMIPGTNTPLVVGPEGWPGMGPGGAPLADQETYSAMYSWRGTDEGESDRRWLRTSMEMRGLAWTGELYQDFIVWIFVIRNIGTAPIRGMRVGIHADFGALPVFLNPNIFDTDRHYYDPDLQLAYVTDDDGYEADPKGGTLDPARIAWSGAMALRMPGPTKKVKTYDAFHFWMEATTPRGNGASKELYFRYNLENLSDPQDSDHDGIDDDFDGNGVPDAQDGGPGFYAASGADGLQVLGSDSLTLAPGQTDTLVFATLFGLTKNQLYTTARRVQRLYNSGWQVVKAPSAPRVEIIPGDGRVTILWGTQSEREQDFEGYKIYRSEDAGVTWGSEKFIDYSGAAHYLPLAQYDKIDSITGHYRTLPEYAWYDLGGDNGLPRTTVISADSLSVFHRGDSVHVFVDDRVTNGLRYRYYVAAYDTGNGITGPLENTPASTPAQGSNTVEVVPHAAQSVANLNAVRVVPNPYVVSNGWEQGQEQQLQFTHLPSQATIYIYNIAGELIQTVRHHAGSSLAPSVAIWDLKNKNQQLVASGLYFYHIDSPVGSAQGKFIVIQ